MRKSIALGLTVAMLSGFVAGCHSQGESRRVVREQSPRDPSKMVPVPTVVE